MGVIRQLYDKMTQVFPVTKVAAVSDNNGTHLDVLLDAKAELDDNSVTTTKGWSSSKIDSQLDGKVSTVSTADKVYGTDEDGQQTAYNKSDFYVPIIDLLP